MKQIKLGLINDNSILAVKDDVGQYHELQPADKEFVKPDAEIFFDSGIYPGITDVNLYMCNKATAQSN